jgi:prolyl-tRNA synthetase
LVRRDTREKLTVPIANLASVVPDLLESIQTNLLANARQMLAIHTIKVDTYDELATRVATNAGWSLAHWCGDASCEARVKTETKATIRCIPFNQAEEAGTCIVCGNASKQRVIFARAY